MVLNSNFYDEIILMREARIKNKIILLLILFKIIIFAILTL